VEETDSEEQKQRAFELADEYAEKRQRDQFDALEEAAPDLVRLDRYERRTWTRQKRAIRAFMNIKLWARTI